MELVLLTQTKFTMYLILMKVDPLSVQTHLNKLIKIQRFKNIVGVTKQASIISVRSVPLTYQYSLRRSSISIHRVIQHIRHILGHHSQHTHFPNIPQEYLFAKEF